MSDDIIAFRPTAADRSLIEAEQARMAKDGQIPSKSGALRRLIFNGSTVTDKAKAGKIVNRGKRK